MQQSRVDRTISTGPLSGIRVLDLSNVVFGPYASQFLGDFGADVVKVEPLEGDSTRHTGPAQEPGMACSFLALNRNKRSVALDLRSEGGRAALMRLVDGADVLMHNIRPQKLAALGLEVDSVRARWPCLVYATLTGFASDGPYAGRPAYDDIIQGMGGLADLMLRQTGQAHYLPTIAADKISALVAAQAIMAAIAGRERTGRGMHVEVSMFEAVAGFALAEHLYGATFQPPRGETGYPRALARARRPYRTRDGYLCVMPYTDVHWARFFAEIGRPEVAREERFTGMRERTQNIDALYALLSQALLERDTQEWLAVFEKLDIPCGKVNALDDVLQDPHLQATGFFRSFETSAGTVRLPGTGVRFEGAARPVTFPPRLGEHTLDLLLEAGLSQDEVGALRRQGQIGTPDIPGKRRQP
jgi:crotonobetainyl-CoA:carnitine CoA-transferase CaiB-like acyl-CoA transferase